MSTLQHDALIYSSDTEFLETVVPFLQEGIANDEGIVVTTNEATWSYLSEALGSSTSLVTYVPSSVVYASVHGAVRAYHEVLGSFARMGKTSVRAIGEVAYPSDSSTHPAWMRYEPIADAVFAQSPLKVICPYDSRKLPQALIDHARLTHPHLVQGQARVSNGAHVPAHNTIADFLSFKTPVSEPIAVLNTSSQNLSSARGTFRRLLTNHLSTERVDEALIALTEVLSNAHKYGRGGVRARVWSEPRAVICSIFNHGTPFDDPFAGYWTPTDPANGGMGLWIARQLADDLAIESTTEGTNVTLLFSKPR